MPRPAVSTKAFDEWTRILGDIEHFIGLSDQALSLFLRDTEASIVADFDPERNHLDYVDEMLSRLGVNPVDLKWMLLAAAIKDVITAYEIYCQSAADEVLAFHGAEFKAVERRWPVDWDRLVEFFRKYLNQEIATPEVTRARDLRHLLTHRRGKLRLERDRRAFTSPTDVYPPLAVQLTKDEVLAILTDLDAVACRIDTTAHEYSVWGKRRLPGLERDIASARP